MTIIKRTFAILIFLELCCFALAQDAEEITFHVTTVSSEEARDWCTTGKCSATRLTVEGYSIAKGEVTSTAYVLNCVEVIANEPTPHVTYQCVRLHANRDYAAKLFADSIAFGQAASAGQFVLNYHIVSEKEVSRKAPTH